VFIAFTAKMERLNGPEPRLGCGVKGSEKVIVILQNARCQIDQQRLRLLLSPRLFRAKPLVAGLFRDFVEMIDVWTAEWVDVVG
jgi:hypothetical protein